MRRSEDQRIITVSSVKVHAIIKCQEVSCCKSSLDYIAGNYFNSDGVYQQ